MNCLQLKLLIDLMSKILTGAWQHKGSLQGQMPVKSLFKLSKVLCSPRSCILKISLNHKKKYCY